MRMYAHNNGSQGGKALAEALGIKRIRHDTAFKPDSRELVLNWGASRGKLVQKMAQHRKWINDPDAISIASNKLSFFEHLKDNKWLPWYTTQKEKAADYLHRKGGAMVCRQILNGSGGAGIVIADSAEQLVDAPLYVHYIQKKDEYRVHVGRKADGTIVVIDTQQKARKLDVPDAEINWRVRNHANGFVFKRNGINPPACVSQAAIECLAGIEGLTFGAVDVVYNAKNNKAAVLEINTAPGLEGQTVDSYAKYFKENF